MNAATIAFTAYDFNTIDAESLESTMFEGTYDEQTAIIDASGIEGDAGIGILVADWNGHKAGAFVVITEDGDTFAVSQ